MLVLNHRSTYVDQWLVRAFSALRRIEAEKVFTFLSTINKDETTQVRATTHKQTYRRIEKHKENTSRKANLVRHEQRLGTSRKLIRTWFDFVFVDGREKSENFSCFYSTKSRECSYSTIDLHMWISG